LSGAKIVNVADSASLPNGDSIGFSFIATVETGTVNFTPSFDIGASINPPTSLSGIVSDLTNPAGVISNAHAIASGTLDANFVVSATLQFSSTITGDDLAQFIAQKKTASTTTVLADYPISLPSISIGPLNAPATAHFKATLDCNFVLGGEVQVEAGAQASATVSAGATYDGTNVTPVFSHTQTLNLNGPNWIVGGDVGIACTVTPVVTLQLWDLASGNVTAQAYGMAQARAQCTSGSLNGQLQGEALAGARATADAKLDIFGLVNWEKECTLFDVQFPVPPATVTQTFTLPGGTNASCTDQPDPAIQLPTLITTPPGNCFGGSSTTDGGTDGDAYDTCSHDVCTQSPLVLGPTCTQDGAGGACIQWICANDPTCCDQTNPAGWDISCTSHVGDPNAGACASLAVCGAD
jgi:hypothetical protein